tara:strand:- start:4304 stop:5446 length:1143 start_codon:yes stop_codon:yes gene_type:complete
MPNIKKNTSQLKIKKILYNNLYIKLYKNGIKLIEYSKSQLPYDSFKLSNNRYIYWNKSYNCWFGSKNCIDNLICNGAQWYSKKNNSNYPKQSFNNMTLEKYGKGYLLIPKKNNSNYGIKYFEGGWWMNTKSAWFFKDSEFDRLIINGAEYKYENKNSKYSYDKKVQFSNIIDEKYILSTYKKGLHLKNISDKQTPLDNYFLGGWWQPKHNAWFFKIESKKHIINSLKNVKLNSDETISKSKYTISEFKKGFHLKHSSKKQIPLDNYWMGGWWQPKHNAWFFKKEKKSEIESCINFSNNYEFDNENIESLSDLSEEYNEMSEGYFKDMILTEYKNGLLLKPPLYHKDFGIKYYNNGYWNNALKGWLFHKSDENKIKSLLLC